MRLIKADPNSDGPRIADFFRRMVLRGSVDFRIDRPDFFAQYRLLSNDFETLLLTDERERVQGMVSLVFSDGFVHGERQTWGYATDLRISPNRKAVLNWSRLFIPELERATEARSCRHVFSAVEQFDNFAYNALIRPQSERRKIPRYFLLNRFRVVLIHGRIPLSRDPLPSISLGWAQESDVSDILAYLRSKQVGRPLAVDHSEAAWQDRLPRYVGATHRDWLIARDSSGKIVGVTLAWRPQPVASWIVHKYHGFAKGVAGLLQTASWLRIVSPLPLEGRPFKTRLLLFLTVDNPDILKALLDHAYNESATGELLAYPYYRGDWKMLPPLSFVSTSLPWGLYLVRSSQDPLPDWLIPEKFSAPPEFQLGWL